uniref:C2H2-type domain-containing protein n=1 Tax=Anopheles christyi TaxID=43041 RepID=A0A182K1N4_9DIPT
MSLIESPKRFFSCATLPSLITHNQRAAFTVADSLAASKSVVPSIMECESRTHDEDMVECVASIEGATCAQLGNINLPHKKRLAKRLETFCNDVSEMEQSLLLANIQLSQRDTLTESGAIESTNNQNFGHSSSLHPMRNLKSNASKTTLAQQASATDTRHPVNSFSCQLCGKVVQDQLMFFNHLKEHYEPSGSVNGSASDATINATTVKTVALSTAESDKGGTLEGKKVKPKLPRVKHTKKLKNDRTVKQGQAEGECPTQKTESAAITANASCSKTMVSLLQNQALNDAMIVLECSENGGEFSETEDMLEGIRNVVQKVQETVDTDTNEELSITNSATWYPNQNDGNGDGTVPATTTIQHPDKGANLSLAGETLDSHEIHIPSGGDNFLLLLSKAQFNDAELLQTESADSTLLKPLDAASCEQLTHTNSLNGTSGNETYVAGLQSTEEQNIQQMQPLHSTPFPLLANVDALSGPHTVSFQSADPLNPLATMLLSSNTMSKLSVASFTSSQCGQIPDLSKTRLLKREQNSDGDDDYEEEGEETSEYQMPLAGLEASGVEPLNGASTDAREQQSVEDYQLSGEEGAEESEEHFTPQVQETNEDEEEMCRNDKERVDPVSSAKLNKYLCPIAECGRWFKSKTAFSYHHLQHTGERPYKCETCQKCFFTCSALKVHERLHSGEKPYKCDDCGHHFR